MLFFDPSKSGHGINLEKLVHGFTGIWYLHTFHGQNLFLTFGFAELSDSGELKFSLTAHKSTGFPVGDTISAFPCGEISIQLRNKNEIKDGFDMVANVATIVLREMGVDFSPPPPDHFQAQSSMILLAG